MEHVPEILKALSDYGLSPVLLVFLVMLYLMGVKSGTFPKFWGEHKEEIPKWAEHLLQNYNHNTTSFHETTHQKLDTLIEKSEEEARQHLEIRDGVKEIQNTLSNFEKFGIKSRIKAR
jgi:hypothetical protein